MTLWILFALMTGLAALSILVPLRRGGDALTAASINRAADEAVYRAQLEEVDRDLQRGLVDVEQAEAARTEIARRLLAAHRQNSGAASTAGTGAARLVQLLASLLLPAAALGLYLWLGSPHQPDQPLEARLQSDPQGQPVEVLVARVERHLAANPQDGQGWDVLAPVYMSLGRAQEAARAYANAIRLNGASEPRESSYGEALVVAAEGLVTAEARAAFDRAVKLDPSAPKPRFFLALALGQEGKREEAITAWKSLLQGADPGAIWVPAAEQQLARLEGRPPASLQPSRGPAAADLEAAASLSDSERSEMIRAMVDGLRVRLETDGGTAEDWLRLIRAQAVLGDKDAARASVARAREALKDDAAALEAVNRAEVDNGLGS